MLWDAFERIQPAYLIDRMRDDIGTFALDTSKGILVAKKDIYGYIVSAHKKAVYSAMSQNKDLIMFIKSSGKFYRFSPKEIIGMSEENTRGDAIMLNFNIKLGKRVVTLAETGRMEN